MDTINSMERNSMPLKCRTYSKMNLSEGKSSCKSKIDHQKLSKMSGTKYKSYLSNFLPEGKLYSKQGYQF